MKPRSIRLPYLVAALFVAAMALVLVSWGRKQDPGTSHHSKFIADTTPQKKNTGRDKTVRNLDEALEGLENMNIDIDADLKKAMMDVELALKDINFDKIKVDIEKAMKEVDFDKIKIDVDKALAQIDFDKMKKDIELSVASIDWDKMKKDMEDVKKIDMDKLEKEMKKVEAELKDMKPRIEAELQKAKVEVEKAKEGLQDFKTFLDALDKEGLISKNGSYSIRHDDGELIINGKKVSDAVYARYRAFLEKQKDFSITKDKDDFDIDMD